MRSKFFFVVSKIAITPEPLDIEVIHDEFKIQEISLERFADLIHKRVHSTSLFIRLANLEGNISCKLNSACMNLYITYHKNDFFLDSVLRSFK